MGGARRPPRPSSAGPMASHATYVYCLTRHTARPMVPRRVTPMPGSGTPRAIAAWPGHWAIVGDVPRETFSAATIERRLGDLDWISRCGAAHQAVVDACLRHTAVVPMTLFTIFDDDERAVAGMRRDRVRLDATLDRVAGRREWVVRVLRPASSTGRQGQDAAARAAHGTADTSAPSETHGATATIGAPPSAATATTTISGRAFLLAKAAQRQAARRRWQDADDALRALKEGLTAIAEDARIRGELDGLAGTPALVDAAMFDAAFLVPAAVEARFKREARRLATALTEQGYGVTVTGPWPCYSFVAQPARKRTKS